MVKWNCSALLTHQIDFIASFLFIWTNWKREFSIFSSAPIIISFDWNRSQLSATIPTHDDSAANIEMYSPVSRTHFLSHPGRLLVTVNHISSDCLEQRLPIRSFGDCNSSCNHAKSQRVPRKSMHSPQKVESDRVNEIVSAAWHCWQRHWITIKIGRHGFFISLRMIEMRHNYHFFSVLAQVSQQYNKKAYKLHSGSLPYHHPSNISTAVLLIPTQLFFCEWMGITATSENKTANRCDEVKQDNYPD